MKTVTRIIDGRANMIWMPAAAKKAANHPPRPNRMMAARPTVTGESANGRSTNAFISARPRIAAARAPTRRRRPTAPVTTTVIDGDDGGQQEGVAHVGLTERLGDDMPPRLEGRR